MRLQLHAKWLLGVVLTAVCLVAMAKPVDVGVRVVGEPGRWVANFWVKNNLLLGPEDMAILVFGLHLPDGSSTRPAPGYDGYSQTWLHHLPGESGGPMEFNQSWTASAGRIKPGEVRGGFVALLSTQALPEEVPWFVLARSPTGGQYAGTEHFGTAEEPLFAGRLPLAAAAVPESATWALMGLGLVVLLWRRNGAERSLARAT